MTRTAHLPELVAPNLLLVMTLESPLTPDAISARRSFIYDHLAGMALVLSLAVSLLTAVATLSITGDLPGGDSTTSASVVPQPSAADAAQRQLDMERARSCTGNSNSRRPTKALRSAN